MITSATEGSSSTPSSSTAAFDARLREAEIKLMQAEVSLKERELEPRSLWKKSVSSPFAPIIATAVIGFVVAQITNHYQHEQNLMMEKEKLKSNLIIKAIE